MGLSGVLHPEDQPIDTAKPLLWLHILEELLEPWRDVRIVITSSRKQTPQVAELGLQLSSLAPRLFGWTFEILPEEEAIAASVRAVNCQLEHLVLVANDFDFSRRSLNYLLCDPTQGLSSSATREAVESWLSNSSPGCCD